jgi:predicted nucleic acid-binding protein
MNMIRTYKSNEISLMAALDNKRRHQFSYWDCAIVASASALGCRELCTEDMTHDQDVDGIALINPF